MRRFAIVVGLTLALSLVLLYFGMRKYGTWAQDDMTGEKRQQALHLVCGADRYWRIDARRLPRELVEQLPIVQKWSITDATILLDCFQKTPDGELRMLVQTAETLKSATDAYLASGVAPNAEEAQAFRNFQDVANLAGRVLRDRDNRKI